jgi:hypothetical protein
MRTKVGVQDLHDVEFKPRMEDDVSADLFSRDRYYEKVWHGVAQSSNRAVVESGRLSVTWPI